MKDKEEKVEAKMDKTKEKDSVECSDKKCPFHGNLSVRGRYFKGSIKKIIGNRAVIELERLRYYKKYERFAKAKTKLHAYIPKCLAKEITASNFVRIGECRPLSKIIHFVVIEKIKQK